MGRQAVTESEARRRREAWRYARKRCGLPYAEIARLVGRSVNTVKNYGTPTGNLPTWAAIGELQGHNLAAALSVVEEKFGPDAVMRFRQETPV